MEWRQISEIGMLAGLKRQAIDLWAKRWDVDKDVFVEKRFPSCKWNIDTGHFLGQYGSPQHWTGIDPDYHATHFLIVEPPTKANSPDEY